ncbi:MAG: hypothetical protein Q7V88_01085 [Actinomycetota bacterium]|nr:hypothetical protein [Actinomycetota bacterium]
MADDTVTTDSPSGPPDDATPRTANTSTSTNDTVDTVDTNGTNGTVDTNGTVARSWPFALAVGATVAALAAFALQLAVVPTLLVLVGVTALMLLDPSTARLAHRLIDMFEIDVTDDSEPLEKRPRLMVALFCLFPLVMAINAWQSSGPDEMWNQLAAAITAAGCWVGWAFAQHGRAIGRPVRWWPVWLTVALAVGVFYTVGGPFRARWAYCQPKLTVAVTRGEEVTKANTGSFCWHSARQRVVDGQTRLYLEGDEGDDDATGLVYSPDHAIERTPGIRMLRDLGDGWYYFEIGSVVRSIWFDG